MGHGSNPNPVGSFNRIRIGIRGLPFRIKKEITLLFSGEFQYTAQNTEHFDTYDNERKIKQCTLQKNSYNMGQDPHQEGKLDPDQHQNDADPQHCRKQPKFEFQVSKTQLIFIFLANLIWMVKQTGTGMWQYKNLEAFQGKKRRLKTRNSGL
jgi:hypothetical protein